LKTELNIHGDEISWRINGKNNWLWAFVGKWTTIYEIDKSRGRIAPMRVLKGYTDK
ncbi:MAG: Transposase, partial [Cenarchaeum symbiont of Oopsacas minuta]|nr:Transposase [Cenarchaeum symbiont of Oopsacas minuta]